MNLDELIEELQEIRKHAGGSSLARVTIEAEIESEEEEDWTHYADVDRVMYEGGSVVIKAD